MMKVDQLMQQVEEKQGQDDKERILSLLHERMSSLGMCFMTEAPFMMESGYATKAMHLFRTWLKVLLLSSSSSSGHHHKEEDPHDCTRAYEVSGWHEESPFGGRGD